MFFSFDCLFLQDGTAGDYEPHTLRLCSGVINNIEFFFPDGCCGLVHVHLNDGLHQIAPLSPDQDLTGSGNIIKYNEDINFVSEPYELQLWGYNLDTEYDHTVSVRIEIQNPESLLRYVMKSLSSLLFAAKD